MKIKPVPALLAVTVLSVLTAVYFFVFREKESPPVSPRVVIIGLDGAGWNIINPLLEENALPYFNYLMKNGSYGTLTTIKPTISSVVWTSIATGKSMVKHGVVDWTYLNKHNIRVPYRRSERRAKTFWNILSELGWRVGVINWFITFPPEEVNGFMVSEEFRHLGKREISKIEMTYPKVLQKKLQFVLRTKRDFPKIREEENLPDFKERKPSGEGPRRLSPFYDNFVIQDKMIELTSLYLFERFPVDAFATYFRLIDVVSHFGCGYIDPQLLKKGKEEEQKGKVSQETLASIDRAFSQILKPVYAYSDRILGKFLKLVNSQTTVIVVSDHGFGFHKGGYGHSDTPEIPHGIILIKGPHIKKGYKIKNAHIYDILPTLLYAFNLPIGKDIDGKVLEEAFDEKFLKKQPIRYIDSYEGEVKIKKGEGDKILDQKTLEELRALGYIK
jgi:predicted AlkP superfamily phosphohydrolase/phosphomutase